MNGRDGFVKRPTVVALLICAVVFVALTSSALAWTIESTPSPMSATGSSLNRISCPNQEWCMAVGYYLNSSGVQSTFAAHREGVYKAETPPNPVGEKPELLGVSCPTTEFCMAVGRYFSSELPLEIADEWTKAGGWKTQTLTMPSGGFASELGNVSCPTSSECMAVGDYHDSAGEHYLAQHWVGSAWTAETPPSPTTDSFPGLTSVDCPEIEECMVAGETKDSSGVFVPASDEWKSNVWKIQTPLHSGSDSKYLFDGVSCPETIKECVGVGSYANATSKVETLAEEWRSSTWEYQITQNNGVPSELISVYCSPTIKECIAVGSGEGFTLGEELSAGKWLLLTTANETGSTADELNGVSCETLKHCFAVGSYTKSGKTWSLAERN
jgi:hypothetical protein